MWTNLAKKIERRNSNSFKIQQLRFTFWISVGVEKYLSNSNNNSTTMMQLITSGNG